MKEAMSNIKANLHSDSLDSKSNTLHKLPLLIVRNFLTKKLKTTIM